MGNFSALDTIKENFISNEPVPNVVVELSPEGSSMSDEIKLALLGSISLP